MSTGQGFEPANLGKEPAERLAAAVLPAAGMVWTAAETMHMTGFVPPSDIVWGTVTITAVAWGAVARGHGIPSVPWWLAAAGGWVAAADMLGPLAWWPAPLLTAAWIIYAFAASRFAYRHDAVTRARRWRQERAVWLARCHDWGLGGSHLLDFTETRLGELYEVSTTGTGRRASQIASSGIAEVIAEAEGLSESRVRVQKHRLAGRILIAIRRIDPWKDALLHPLVCEEPETGIPEARSILDEAMVGQDPETGVPLTIPMYDKTGGKNISVTGIKGAGKGVLLDDLSEWVTAADDAIMVRLNVSVKGYAEAESWGPACHLTAFGPEQKSRAALVLQVIGSIIEWRAKTYPRGQYKPSPRDPAVVLFVDESDSASEVPAIRKGLNDIATKGREYGVTLVHAGQRGTADYSSAKARSQDDVWCTGAVSRKGEQRHAGGANSLSGADMSTYGEGQPGVWKIARLGGSETTGRTWVFSDDPEEHGAEVERIAQERAFSQPDLPAACKEYLGDAYATLLATEVFARWARQQERGVHDPDDRESEPADGPQPAAPASPSETHAAPAASSPASRTALAERDPFEKWLEMDVDPETTQRLAAIHEKLAGARQALGETLAVPLTSGTDPGALAAHARERWRELGEQTVIPPDIRPRLLEMLARGTTISAVAEATGVKRWEARKWLARLGFEGVAGVEGEGKARRWVLVPPPGDGDAQ